MKRNNKILVRLDDEEEKILDEIIQIIFEREKIKVSKALIFRYGVATIYKLLKSENDDN